MGIETAIIASAVIGTVTSVASGFMEYRQQKKADKQAAQAADAEARLTEQDAERAALEEQRAADKARKQQRMAFLSSGVDLEGSPLLVMQETTDRGNENAKNVRETGKARADLIRKGAVKRANLLGTALDAASTTASNYSQMQMLRQQIA